MQPWCNQLKGIVAEVLMPGDDEARALVLQPDGCLVAAGRVGNESRTIERVEPFLTLEGLRIIFEKNRDRSGKERSA